MADLNNYGQVFPNPHFTKIVEKVMALPFKDLLDEMNYLNPFQAIFRSKYSIDLVSLMVYLYWLSQNLLGTFKITDLYLLTPFDPIGILDKPRMKALLYGVFYLSKAIRKLYWESSDYLMSKRSQDGLCC